MTLKQYCKETQYRYSSLNGYQSWRYSELLLTQGLTRQAEASLQGLELAKQMQFPLQIAFAHLSAGLVLLSEARESGAMDCPRAAASLQCAVEGLREGGPIALSPGLLARAQFYRFTRDYERAERDLNEVLRIVTRSGMDLALADYHVESARLRLVQGEKEKAHEHWTTAKEMIERMGYHRRDKEVKEIEEQLS